jgi:tetratricopeptide (TPR) repeat protein
MSRLLEILGSAVKYDTAELVWNWLGIIRHKNGGQLRYKQKDGRRMGGTADLDDIIELSSERDSDSAENKLSSYLAENPDCVLGRLAAAAISISKGKIDEAAADLNSVYHRQPSNTMALYALGHCCELKGSEAEAIAFYQDCIKFKSYLQLPRERLAAIYFKNGQIERAIQEYEFLRRDNPDYIPAVVTLGHLYIEAGRYSDAIDAFNTAILIHPDNFDDIDSETEQLVTDGKFEEAAERLEGLISGQPERADLRVRFGDVLSMLGSDSESTEQYEEAIRLRPDFLEATIKLGTQLIQTGQEQAAAVQFNKALEINEQIIDAYIGLATAQIRHGRTGRQTEAMETLALACAIVPNSTLLFAQTAILQLKSGLDKKELFYPENSGNLLTDVIDAHQKHIERQADNPDLFYRLGILMCAAGKIEEAAQLFKSAIELNPYYARARNKYVLCLFEAGERDKGLENLIGPSCLDKTTLELHYKTALLYCDKIKFAASMMNLENALESNETGCNNTTFNISIVLQNLGLLDRAVAMWENLSDTTRQAIKSKDTF